MRSAAAMLADVPGYQSLEQQMRAAADCIEDEKIAVAHLEKYLKFRQEKLAAARSLRRVIRLEMQALRKAAEAPIWWRS